MNLKYCYDKWVDEGKPELTAVEIDQMLNETYEIDLEDDNTNFSASVACTPPSANAPNTLTVIRERVKFCLS